MDKEEEMADEEKDKPRRGRRRIGSEKRSVAVTVRVTPEQSRAMHAVARAAKKSLAQLIIDCTIGGK